MLHAIKQLFVLINSILARLIGVADDTTYVLASGAAQLRHEASSGFTEGCKIVDKRDAQQAKMLELSPPSEPA